VTLPEALLALAAAQAVSTEHETAYQALSTYDVALRALGEEPREIVAKPEPTKPAGARPDAAALDEARAVLKQRDVAAGETVRVKAELAAAEKEWARLNREHAEAELEASRVSALLSAARSAPTDIIREQIGALGDLGSVSIEFPERENDKSPHVRVTVLGEDGNRYAWGEAGVSDGAMVIASLQMRAAIRRAAAVQVDKSFRWLPIIADNLNLWNGGAGPWPDVEGPVWWNLTTPPGTKLVVRAGRPT
jgi:hypothetical protein